MIIRLTSSVIVPPDCLANASRSARKCRRMATIVRFRCRSPERESGLRLRPMRRFVSVEATTGNPYFAGGEHASILSADNR